MSMANANFQAMQLMQLQTACADCKYLAVLDDLWEVEHELHLNPFDEAGLAASGAKVLVTTRFQFGFLCVGVRHATPVRCALMVQWTYASS
jgi:hypothetical protein